MKLITEEQFAESILTELLEILAPFPNVLDRWDFDEMAKIGDGLRQMSTNILSSNRNIMYSEQSRAKLAAQIMLSHSDGRSQKCLLNVGNPRVKASAVPLARNFVGNIESSLKIFFNSNEQPVCYFIESENWVQASPYTLRFNLSGDGGILDSILCSDAASCMGIAIAARNAAEIGVSPEINWVWWPSARTISLLG